MSSPVERRGKLDIIPAPRSPRLASSGGFKGGGGRERREPPPKLHIIENIPSQVIEALVAQPGPQSETLRHLDNQ